MDTTKLKDLKTRIQDCLTEVNAVFNEGGDSEPITYKNELAAVRDGLNNSNNAIDLCINSSIEQENVKAEAAKKAEEDAKKAAEEQAAADAEGDNQA